MTTVVDPTGSPTIIFNRSGTTIVSLLGGFYPQGVAGSPNGNDGVDIPRLSQMTIVLASTTTVFDSGGVNITGFNSIFRLPTGAEIGDAVEIYQVSEDSRSGGPTIFPQIGEQILTLNAPNGAVSDGTNTTAQSAINPGAGGRVYRKISSTTWVAIGPA
jgi:hypothetical protein